MHLLAGLKRVAFVGSCGSLHFFCRTHTCLPVCCRFVRVQSKKVHLSSNHALPRREVGRFALQFFFFSLWRVRVVVCISSLELRPNPLDLCSPIKYRACGRICFILIGSLLHPLHFFSITTNILSRLYPESLLSR